MSDKITWKEVKEKYEDDKNTLGENDLNTPELVSKYIEKYELSSDVAKKIFSLYGSDKHE